MSKKATLNIKTILITAFIGLLFAIASSYYSATVYKGSHRLECSPLALCVDTVDINETQKGFPLAYYIEDDRGETEIKMASFFIDWSILSLASLALLLAVRRVINK